jgi:hypothetical protein
MRAKEFIETSLLATLPPGVPPFFTKIISAAFETKSTAKHRCAYACLELVDGTQAYIELWEHGTGGAAYQWTSFEGDLSYENGKWVRHEELIPIFSPHDEPVSCEETCAESPPMAFDCDTLKPRDICISADGAEYQYMGKNPNPCNEWWEYIFCCLTNRGSPISVGRNGGASANILPIIVGKKCQRALKTSQRGALENQPF